MGASSSKSGRSISLDPFPLDNATVKDLNKLSDVVARILSTPDIYDVNNLSKAGTCGDYAVFLKKTIEKKMLPFVVDLSGVRTEVVYQDRLKAFSTIEERKKVCVSLAETMVRLIATVVACMASIQVRDASRTVGMSTVQRGGDINGIYDWFSIAGYVPAVQGARLGGQALEFKPPGAPPSPFKYTLTLERSEGNLSHGLIHVANAATVTPPMPSGALRIQFLNPVSLPVQGVAAVTVLPMRIIDNAGLPWCSGVFYEDAFKSFSSVGAFYISDLFEQLFRRTQGVTITAPIETRDQMTKANEVFQQIRRTQNPQVVIQALNQFFAQHVQGYQAGYQAPAPGLPGYPAPGYPQPAPGYPYAMPGAYFPQQPQFVQPLQPLRPFGTQQLGLRSGYYGLQQPTLAGGPTASDYSYDIPINASQSIRNALTQFRSLIPTESTPAYARAYTLAGNERDDRKVKTGVCTDAYWATTPDKIFPWSTLQFLSIKEWKKIGENRTNALFHNEWNDFVTSLKSEYDGSSYPKLDGPTNFLDQMRFSGVDKIKICTKPPQNIVAHQAINDGLLEIQGMYSRHVPKVWAILNDLIFVLQDPDTKQDVVRLHANVTKGPSSQAYVEGKAEEARKLLTGFYLDVERAYKRAVQSLKPV